MTQNNPETHRQSSMLLFNYMFVSYYTSPLRASCTCHKGRCVHSWMSLLGSRVVRDHAKSKSSDNNLILLILL